MKTKEKLLSELITYGILTGSVRLRIAHEKSDVDYIIPKKKFENIAKSFLGSYIFNDMGYRNVEEFRGSFLSYHMVIGDKKYNFIVPQTTLEYKAWRWATRMIIQCPKELWEKKEVRVRTFDFLKQIAREMDTMESILPKNPQGEDIPF